MKKGIIFGGIVLAGIYLFFFLLALIRPDVLLYHPIQENPSLTSAQQIIPDLHWVSYSTPDGRPAKGWYARPQNAHQIVVFLHGNSYNIGAFVHRVEPFYRAGYAVLMPEYTGFGGMPGTPNQTQIEQDVAGAISFLHQQGFSNHAIILYGYSLGTYLAVYAAADLNQGAPFNAVILEAPFTSLADTADWTSYHLFPVHWLLKDHYHSLAKIRDINAPLFIAHGTNDRTVPYFMGEALFNAARHPKTFLRVVGATHQNLPDHGFLNKALEWLK